VVDLLGREDEGHGDLFFERWDVEEGIVLTDSPSNEETKETPCGNDHIVHGAGLHDEIGPHVEEKGRVKRTQIRSALMHITVKDPEVVIAGSSGISEASPINDVVV